MEMEMEMDMGDLMIRNDESQIDYSSQDGIDDGSL
jgi:hypothetical protein